MKKHKWLTYSENKNGLFCKYFVLFSDKGGKDRATPLKKFVNEPLKKYAKLWGKDSDLEVHRKLQYHIECLLIAEDFKHRYQNPDKDIINIMNTERINQINENRNRLKPIIETIIFLGRQNIPLRGHHDSGDFFQKVNDSVSTTESTVNKGNFRDFKI